ncbi:hypothetical protein [Poriferisphaera sp. WC338]|uniref:hypothetical protein n=1 Tax=Poriferisphaera sp. WC338 TaxID=3425129 RepID=UPI003D8196F1
MSEAGEPQRKIGGMGCLLGGLVLLEIMAIGLVVCGIMFGIVPFVNTPLQRVVVPGGGVVMFEEKGEYEMYYEYVSEVGGVKYQTPSEWPGAVVKIKDLETGLPVFVAPNAYESTYSTPTYSGKLMGKFGIPHPGRYEISGSYPYGVHGPSVVMAVGDMPVGLLILGIVAVAGGALLGALFFAAGVVVLIVIMLRRKNATATG